MKPPARLAEARNLIYLARHVNGGGKVYGATYEPVSMGPGTLTKSQSQPQATSAAADSDSDEDWLDRLQRAGASLFSGAERASPKYN